MSPGATARCLDCPVERSCAYSALRIYARFLDDPVHRQWPLGVLTDDPTPAGLRKALRDGPYGTCVYSGRNDVVDHQVVTLEYDGGVTASFTMTAFTTLDFRKTRLFGTLGSIDGDGRTLTVHDFLTDTVETIDLDPDGGADTELVRAFLAAVATGDHTLITSGPRESVPSPRPGRPGRGRHRSATGPPHVEPRVRAAHVTQPCLRSGEPERPGWRTSSRQRAGQRRR
ncbi:hypothetical protein AB0G05_17440 [Nonomuraea wenchangensis]